MPRAFATGLRAPCLVAALAALAAAPGSGALPRAADLGASTALECRDGVCFLHDVPYAHPPSRSAEKPLLVDLYAPEGLERPVPGFLLIHGGGWQVGSKNGRRKDAHALARRGYVGVTVEYRLTGEAIYPAAVDDVKAAVRWVRGHAAALGVDPRYLVAVGGSAGSHLSSFLGTTGDDPRFEGDTLALGVDRRDPASGRLEPGASSAIAAAAPQSSTVHFAFQCDLMRERWPQPGTKLADSLWPSGGAIFLGCECFDQDIDRNGSIEEGYEQGCPERWEEASPAAHVSPGSVPHLFYSPAPDVTKPGCVPDQSDHATFFRSCGSDAFRSDLHALRMADQLEEAGVYNRVVLAVGGDHVFHGVDPWFDRVLDDLVEFVEGCLIHEKCGPRSTRVEWRIDSLERTPSRAGDVE